MQVTNFNLRVYGLLIHEGQVLITHEHRAGLDMTKFPGGGLEKGEGIEQCLKREFYEELNLEIEVGDFFYVNDFLQLSAFNPSDQLISFYYYISVHAMHLDLVNSLVNRRSVEHGQQQFDWVRITDLAAETFTFPIDQVVAKRLKKLHT